MDSSTQIMSISKRMTRKLQAFIRSKLSATSKELLVVTERAMESLERRTDAKIISNTQRFLDQAEDLEQQINDIAQLMEKEGIKQGLYMKNILKELQEIHHCMSIIVKKEQDFNLKEIVNHSQGLGMDDVDYPSIRFGPPPQTNDNHSNQSSNPAREEHGYIDRLVSPVKSFSIKRPPKADTIGIKKSNCKEDLNCWEDEGQKNKQCGLKEVFSKFNSADDGIEDCPEKSELPPKKRHCISKPLSPPGNSMGCSTKSTTAVKKQDTIRNKQCHCFRKFTGSDVELLIRGIEKFGVGRWLEIKGNYFSSKKHWSTTVLKDKWRSLVHSASLPHGCRRSVDLSDSQVRRILHISSL